MSQKISTRQLRQHTVLPMIGNTADEAGDSVLSKIDAQAAKLFEDRNIMLTDGGIVTFTGTSVQFTEALNIVLNQKTSGATPQVISLGATTRTFTASGRMLYAVIDRGAGTATVTADATTLPAAVAANQEVFLIAKRVDATDGTQRLYFRTGAAFNAGQSARLGSAGSGSGGSGTGDDLNALTFKASFTDLFDDIPTSANAGVDTGAGKTDATLYSAVSALFKLAYDASKTVTGTGVNMTLSGTPGFTVKVGDLLIKGTQARRITTVTSQTVYVIESAFTTDPTAAQATVSQAVYSKDINNFAGDGIAPSTAFSTTINQIMAVYEDTSTVDDKIFDANTVPVIGFTASSDGTNFTDVKVRPTNLSEQITMTDLPTASTSLYIRLFANKTSGSGTVNVLGYKVFFHRDTQAQDGSQINQAYARTDGIGTQVNVAALAVTGGKTRLKTNFSFPVGVNSTTTNGSLKVYLNGQKIPRFLNATTTPDAFYKEIDQTTIELDSDYSSLSLALEVVQDTAVVDVSDTNVTAITQNQEIMNEAFQGMVKTSQLMNATSAAGSPAAGTFHSTISNRAAIPDLSQDLKARMGIDRLMTPFIATLLNEFGPNGEAVSLTPNDVFNQIRFVGNWINQTTNSGNYVQTAVVGDYIELVFYGTGLNIIAFPSDNTKDARATVDGGTEGSNIFAGATESGALLGRGYGANVVRNVVSGLTLGIHTVKIRHVLNNLQVFGFETITQSSTLVVNPGVSYIGGKKLVNNTQSSTAYNSGFESGTVGTRGGRAVIYQKADGTIAKSINPASTQLNLASADHSNEEVARVYHWREFGSGRSDDFSTLVSSTSNRAFVLDDGTTCLLGSSVATGSTPEAVHISDSVTLTFFGTGLDVVNAFTSTPGTLNVIVDGTNVGTFPAIFSNKTAKLVSGLPVGTHVVKIQSISGNSVDISKFLVYQPKKPTQPSGSIELAEYLLLADFVANSTAGLETISTGVLRKHTSREIVAVDGTTGTTWALSGAAPTSDIGGTNLNTSRNNAYVEQTFFGTGFDMRFSSSTVGSSSIQVSLQALSTGGSLQNLTTTNFPSITSSVYGSSITFNNTTGILSQLAASPSLGNGFRVSGLPLGLYKFRMLNNTASAYLLMNCLDVITPTYYPKGSTPFELQNTLKIGSSSLSDTRQTLILKGQQTSNKFRGVAYGVSTGATTSSGSYVPAADMSLTVPSKGGWFTLAYSIMHGNTTAAADNYFQLYVDGQGVGQEKICANGTSYSSTVSDSIPFYLPAGVHKVDVYIKVSTGTLGLSGARRNLSVTEI